ncbi:MAG: isopenicillin-N epimerase [Psychromonas sp.]|jgi:isopenicillin-N epimerase
MKEQFLLDPNVVFLNHGSFGACPKEIFADYQNWQLKLEQQPVDFVMNEGPKVTKIARERLAEYIHCDADDLVYVTNPTYAANVIAKNLKLTPGDEILMTDLEYGAIDRAWEHYSEIHGTKVVRAKVALPIVSHEQFISDFLSQITSKTKVIFISEITSTTALKFPVKEICDEAKKKGIITIVDGAHSPSHIDINVSELKADFYIGACHKWMLTPKGSSFMYVKKEFQKDLAPLVVSWGYNPGADTESQFLDYHQFNGTRDYSAFLTIPKALDWLKANDWDEKSKVCREMIRSNYKRFCDLMGTTPLCPIEEKYLGQICSIPVNTKDPVGLKNELINKYKIEIPVMPHNDACYIRISVQAYNTQKELDYLYECLSTIKEEGKLVS